jgi:hypothetical protein
MTQVSGQVGDKCNADDRWERQGKFDQLMSLKMSTHGRKPRLSEVLVR